jgi:hypothetical protein
MPKLLKSVYCLLCFVVVACSTDDNQAPVASFTISSLEENVSVSPDLDFLGEQVTLINIRNNATQARIRLDASDSTDPDGDSLSYNWDLGDGTQSQNVTIEKTYPLVLSEKPVTIQLTVTDSQGKASRVAKQILVDPGVMPLFKTFY